MDKSNNIFFADTEDVFVKSLKKYVRPITKKKLTENYFYIKTSIESTKFKKIYLELYGSIIIFRRGPKKKETNYMDVKNTFLKITNLKMGDKLYFSIKFNKPTSYEQIFHPSKTVIEEWYYYLKRYCILTGFNKKFKSIKVLGEGNFAKVYLVEKLRTGKKYAVKVFSKKAIMKNEKEKQTLINEVKIMRMVDHKRILKIKELYEGEKHIYFLLELCEGMNLLDHLIEKGYQPETKALTILMQILEGLNYLHSKKIIHRDIKPDNILFQDDNRISITIVDLGFATMENEYDKLFAQCGTPGYIAPEILKKKKYNTKVDIFSAGVIMYIILTGRMPFSGNSYNKIVLKNLKGEINFNFDHFNIKVSKETLDLLKKMLETNPEKRYNAIEALQHDAFRKILSISPLVIRNYFDPKHIINNQKITKTDKKKKINPYMQRMPNRIEDLSPVNGNYQNDKFSYLHLLNK